MRTQRSLLTALAVAAVFALSACGQMPAGLPLNGDGGQSPAPTATASANNNPSPAPSTAPSSSPGIDPAGDPVPPTVSTGPVPVTTWKGTPAASLVYVDAKEILAKRADGTTLGEWILPGSIADLVSGLTTAFGHSPLVNEHGAIPGLGWDYVWDGFTIWDLSPLMTGPTDPAYHYYVDVNFVDGVEVKTVNGIHVGSPASDALAVADDSTSGTGFFWAAIGGFPVSVPSSGSPYIAVNVAATGPSAPITEISGPIGSWLS